jgi:hypothetical protein
VVKQFTHVDGECGVLRAIHRAGRSGDAHGKLLGKTLTRATIKNVLFSSLATGKLLFLDKATSDGLNLTRCVKAAIKNRLPFIFPRDFSFLTTLLSSPRTVRAVNYNCLVFSCWSAMSIVTM